RHLVSLLSVSAILPLPLFFFQWFGPPRALPSFPTRRSSDLDLAAGLGAQRRARRDVIGMDVGLDGPGELEVEGVERGAIARQGRSEEHTSELQSPCNLVCRLLLEKKKTKTKRKTGRLTTATT